MNRIKSFTINHNLLMPGFYISREDGDVITYDLHTDEALMQGNIMTEYEEKFSAAGNPICKYIICR